MMFGTLFHDEGFRSEIRNFLKEVLVQYTSIAKELCQRKSCRDMLIYTCNISLLWYFASTYFSLCQCKHV